MRKFLGVTTAFALLLSLTACRNQSAETLPEKPSSNDQTETQPILKLDTLAVELSRNGLSGQRLLQAARELPEELQTCLAEYGVQVDTVTVSVGTSTAATAQALSEGSIDLAFLPAEDFLEFGTQVTALLGDGSEPLTPGGTTVSDWNQEQSVDPDAPWTAGVRTLICTGPSPYGIQLSGRETPTWEELSHAHWGVLQTDSLSEYRAFDLWLSDQYEGNQVLDLPEVTVYDTEEALFRAAAAGEIDAFPLRADARLDAAEVWTMDASQTDGLDGFGRTSSVWEEVRVIGVTEPLLSTVAAVSQQRTELLETSFQTALSQALQALDAEQRTALGALEFAPIDADALNPLRRLLTIEGVDIALELPGTEQDT